MTNSGTVSIKHRGPHRPRLFFVVVGLVVPSASPWQISLATLVAISSGKFLNFVPLQRIANRLVNLFETHTYTTEVVFDHAVEQLEWNVGNNIVF